MAFNNHVGTTRILCLITKLCICVLCIHISAYMCAYIIYNIDIALKFASNLCVYVYMYISVFIYMAYACACEMVYIIFFK